MTKAVFIASAEPYSGKSVITIGLINMLLGKADKIGYFKPIINQDRKDKKDTHIDMVLTHFTLPVAYEDTFAYTRQQVLHLIETNSQREIINVVIGKYKKLEENYDFTVIEGSDFLGEGTAFEFEYNISIAKTWVHQLSSLLPAKIKPRRRSSILPSMYCGVLKRVMCRY